MLAAAVLLVAALTSEHAITSPEDAEHTITLPEDVVEEQRRYRAPRYIAQAKKFIDKGLETMSKEPPEGREAVCE
jgi:hypothetical protein